MQEVSNTLVFPLTIVLVILDLGLLFLTAFKPNNAIIYLALIGINLALIFQPEIIGTPLAVGALVLLCVGAVVGVFKSFGSVRG